jgi:hypothetical protein
VKKHLDKKLLLSKETIRRLVPDEMNMVVGGICQSRISRTTGAETACDCSGSATATGTCGDCTTIQY